MRAKIVAEETDMGPNAPDLCQTVGPERIMVVGLTTPAYKQYDGWRLDKIAAALNRPWGEALVDIVIAEDDRPGKITFSMSEENVAMQLARPWVVIGTDAGGSNPDSAHDIVHPRGYGSYPKILGRYVREQHLLTLEDAVRKMTSAVAARLSLFDRGIIREGMYADLVLFDPATVIDKATFDKPHQLSVGIIDVWVNGVQVLNDGVPTGARPGSRGPRPGLFRELAGTPSAEHEHEHELLPHQLPILDPMRLVRVGALPLVEVIDVGLVVPFEPEGLANPPRRRACASPRGRGTTGRAR